MGKPYRAPEPPPLPTVRDTEAPLFTVTGVDFTSALYVRVKGILFVFSCEQQLELSISK